MFRIALRTVDGEADLKMERTAGIRGMDFIEKSGKSEKIYDPYFMHASTSEGIAAINKWRQHILNDFAARMCWATTDKFSDANHHPVVVFENDSTFNFLVKQLRQGKYCSWMLLHRMTPMEIIYIIIGMCMRSLVRIKVW